MITQLKNVLEECDAVVIGAGAGLSTAAGYIYTGENFKKYFSDFEEKYDFHDMYSGGFYPYDTPEEMWAYWSRYTYVNRYLPIPSDLYEKLFSLVKDKDYFVLTTNVDHCFQRTGFDKKRLFYTQGDYGLWQCSEPCHQETYENRETVEAMLRDQGYEITEDGSLFVPEGRALKRRISSDLLPKCPHCGKPLTMNLRSDNKFVEDEGWHSAAGRYGDYLARHGIEAKGFFTGDSSADVDRSYDGKILFLELGVGYNTPGIIKYPFWQMTYQNKKAVYACLNMGDAAVPKEIKKQSICIDGDIREIIDRLV